MRVWAPRVPENLAARDATTEWIEIDRRNWLCQCQDWEENMTEEKTRGVGCILVAIAGVLFAERSGMPGREVAAIFVLVALGLLLLVNGRPTVR
jgi:hypothetical protein